MSEVSGKIRNETVFQLKSMLAEEIALIEAYETISKNLKRDGSPNFGPVLLIEGAHRKIADRLIEEIRSRGAVVATGPEDKLKLPLTNTKITPGSGEVTLFALREAEERGIQACEKEDCEQMLDEASEPFIAGIVHERRNIVSQLQTLLSGV